MCDNGAEIVWNKKEWAPVFKNLTQNKTQCSLYFEEQPGKVAVKYITELASTDPTNLKADDTDDANIRYVGASPNNFVYFNNNEKWRIIGIINGKLKIIRNESIGNMAWDTNDNTWSSSTLANYLNNEYNVIDDVLAIIENWNVGRADNGYTAKEYYNYEQDETWTGKVGLMSVSDYGYAVGNSAREKCLGSTLFEYNNGSCEENNWIYHMIGNTSGWTINAFTPEEPGAFYVYDNGRVSLSVVNQKYSVFPAVYLNEDVRIIDGTGEEGNPFILE